MAGHSRSKTGVASLAFVPAIHAFDLGDAVKTWMPGTRPGMTEHVVQLEKIMHKNTRIESPYSAAIWACVCTSALTSARGDAVCSSMPQLLSQSKVSSISASWSGACWQH